MNTPAQQRHYSPADYLDFERHSPPKNEYRRGFIYAMAGGKKNHVWITTNLGALLATHLADSPCVVAIADMKKVRIETADCYYYPDISVTCDDRDRELNDDFIPTTYR